MCSALSVFFYTSKLMSVIVGTELQKLRNGFQRVEALNRKEMEMIRVSKVTFLTLLVVLLLAACSRGRHLHLLHRRPMTQLP